MITPTPDDLDRQAAEYAKNQCMDMSTPTPETDAAEAVCIHPRHVPDSFARKLERQRDEARTAFETAIRERNAATDTIKLTSELLVAVIAERDEWKAKAERLTQ